MHVRLGQTGSTASADCQLFLWQAERTTRRHSRDDPREDVGVGPVEFQLNEAEILSSAWLGDSLAPRTCNIVGRAREDVDQSRFTAGLGPPPNLTPRTSN